MVKGTQTKSDKELVRMAQDLMKIEKINYTTAFRRVCAKHPELYELYIKELHSATGD